MTDSHSRIRPKRQYGAVWRLKLDLPISGVHSRCTVFYVTEMRALSRPANVLCDTPAYPTPFTDTTELEHKGSFRACTHTMLSARGPSVQHHGSQTIRMPERPVKKVAVASSPVIGPCGGLYHHHRLQPFIMLMLTNVKNIWF